MKFNIEESRDTDSFKNMPISYRVSLKIIKNTVVLKREYFRVGFNSGEQYDNFYFDNEWSGKQNEPLERCTFITKRIDDKKYLMEKEKDLIKLFYEKCTKSRDLLKNQLIQKTKNLNDSINNYNDILDYFEYTQRDKKLKKIKYKINE